MMLPPMTTSPPNFLTPRRRPAESRPLREEPPAFLCAISLLLLYLSAGADIGDAEHRDLLPVAVLAPVVVAALLLEDDDLVALLVLEHGGGDRPARECRGAGLGLDLAPN